MNAPSQSSPNSTWETDKDGPTTSNLPHIEDTTSRVRKACDFCRGRRIKCQFSAGSQSCQSCLTRKKKCVFTNNATKNSSPSAPNTDLTALGPLAMLRHNFLSGPSTPAALNAAVEKMTSELKIYKEMAEYWQNKVSLLAKQTLESQEKSPGASLFDASNASSPSSEEAVYTRTTNTYENYSVTQMIQLCNQAYLETVDVLTCGEGCLPTVVIEGAEDKYKLLLGVLILQDTRAPEDSMLKEGNAHNVELLSSPGSNGLAVFALQATSLESLIELWEYAVVFAIGASALNMDDVVARMGNNAERLMRTIIFQREAHTQERFAERLVRSLLGMCIHYRRLTRVGAASSVLMIAHQIVASFPYVIRPILSDRVYVLLLLGASTEHERREWLHMLHDQIHFNTTTLISFNVGFIVSKLRTNPILKPDVLHEITSRVNELEELVSTLSPSATVYPVWLRLLITCFRGEIEARCNDIEKATLEIVKAEQILRENYTSSLALILICELKNFANHCSPCRVRINGKDEILCLLVIDRFEKLYEEMSSTETSRSTISPVPVENSKSPLDSIFNSASTSYTSVQMDDPFYTKESPVIFPPDSIPNPLDQTANGLLNLSSECVDDVYNSWAVSGNRLNDELFGSVDLFPATEF